MLGGASIALKDYITKSEHIRYFEIEEDICSNSKGFLTLTKALLKKRFNNDQI